MKETDVQDIDTDKMQLLMKMRDWFTLISSRGDNINWSSRQLGGSTYTRTMIEYLDDIIERGWYSNTEHSSVLNWMRELWILNKKGVEIDNPITRV